MLKRLRCLLEWMINSEVIVKVLLIKKGKETQLMYTATFDVKPHRYLKITHKGHHVETFEEVEKGQMKKSIRQIESIIACLYYMVQL